MLYIAHRGNINGPSDHENTQQAIDEALAAGYHCEVDVWLVDDSYWLGHDAPTHKIELQNLIDSWIWCHAKTPETLVHLAKHSGINAFFQQYDEVALTTNGYFWCHSEHPIPGPRSVVVDLENKSRWPGDTYALCTDYPWGQSAISEEKKEIFPKLIVLDVDGVLTDGTKCYDRDGKVISKTFYDKDWTAIKRFQAAGLQVVLLSSDTICNQGIAANRQLDFISVPAGVDKISSLRRLCDEYAVDPKEIVYVGDDYYDLMLLESVGYPYCPNDSISDVKAVAKMLPEMGGFGVIQALYEDLRGVISQVYPADSPDVNPA